MKEQQEQLELKKIIGAINPKNRQYLSKIEIFESIESTNSYLLDQLKRKAQSGRVCLADQQTQGRGRQGRQWFSPPGANIYCSLSWCFPNTFNSLSALSIATAVIIIKALKNLALKQDLGLKWPNDIWVSGRKLAGILLENAASATENKIVVGIGLNLNLPEEKRKSWIGLSEIQTSAISRNVLVGILLDELLMGISLFEKAGLAPFLPLCRDHDILKGKEVIVATPQTQFSGRACGINDQGELIVRDKKEQRRCFSYGEISMKLLMPPC